MTMTAVALLLLSAASAARAGVFAPSTFQDSFRLLARSSLAEAAGDFGAARASAESLANLDPASGYAAARVARLSEAAGQDVDALEWGERALVRDSLNVSAAMLVGRMRLRSGDFGVAVQALTPPLRSLGAPPELYALRAIAHELNRNYEAALADLRRTEELEDDFAWVAGGVLGLALEENRLAEAYQALELALELSPSDARVRANGVTLARRAGDRVLEETLLREVAIADGSTPAQIAEYGASLLRGGRGREFSQLLRWADAARGADPVTLRLATAGSLLAQHEPRRALAALRACRKDPRGFSLQARAHGALGEGRKALRRLRDLRRLALLSHDDSLELAYYEIRRGDRRLGLEALESARPSLFESPRRIVRGSVCYSLLGHPEEAVALLRDAALRGMESPSMYEEMGSIATDVGDSLLAEWAYQRLLSLGRETSECMYYLAASELGRGGGARAEQYLERAIQLDEQNGRALLLLGVLRLDRGQLESARTLLQRAAGIPGTSREANGALARVCRSLHLDAEARAAETRARSSRAAGRPPAGLTLTQRP
ncbi:MAG TPA: tetratricopeptide repeat protein [Candidatus Eisenbacteria bacterium]|jgi:tetratricopeptide (TPR) repeat protein